MTSRAPTLLDHMTMKHKELLKTQAFAALANHGAFLWIDTMDAVGAFNPRVFEVAGDIFSELKRYESYVNLESAFCHDVVIYMNFESQINFKQNGETNRFGLTDGAYMNGIMQLARTLIYANIPFGVITKKNLHELSNFPVVMLPNQLMMDEQEVEAFRSYVAAGGSLYASKWTSLTGFDGQRQTNFRLSDVFGVDYTGEETVEPTTYVEPNEQYRDLFAPYDEKYPLTLFSSQIKVEAHQDTKVLGKIQLPLMIPFDPLGYTACVTDPPLFRTELPAVAFNEYGKGRCLYAAGDLETMKEDEQREVMKNLIRFLLPKPSRLLTNAPKPVEITLFHDHDHQRFIVNVLNFQSEMPNLPVMDLCIDLYMEGREPLQVLLVPDRVPMAFEYDNERVSIQVPRLDTFLMISVEY